MTKKPKLSQNDFYVAIQSAMTAAHDAGWDLDQIHEYAHDAADEWLGEMQTDEFDGEDHE